MKTITAKRRCANSSPPTALRHLKWEYSWREMVNIHRIFYPVLALGPGRRIGIWTRGCSQNCPGCLSPDMQTADAEHDMPLRAVFAGIDRVFREQPVDGVTVSGGEPTEQWDDLLRLLDYLQDYTEDVLLYTGLSASELRSQGKLAALKERAGVLVTGPYVEAFNDGRPLRGSSNQQILFCRPELEPRYESVLKGPRILQPVELGREEFIIGLFG